MKKLTIIILLLISLLFLSACAAAGGVPDQAEGLAISVSVLPQKYFVERIGGEHVQVNVMVGPGDSPHSYEPKASQMTALSRSDAYFMIGVEFEDAWMARISAANPDMQIVDVSADITRIEMAADAHADEEDHSDGSENGHEIDPHVWTSPQNGILIAGKIADTFISLDPNHADEYRANLDALTTDIHTLQRDIEEALSGLENRSFLVFHPSWGYFADEFSLIQIPIEIGGSEPSPRELTYLMDLATAQDIHVIFAQPEFSTRTAENIAAEINGKVILIDPLAEDWLDNLRQVAVTISEAL